MENINRTNISIFSIHSKESRFKTRSFIDICTKTKPSQFTNLQEFNVELSPTLQNRLTLQSLSSYARRLAKQIYEVDPLGIGKLIEQFLFYDLQRLRQRIQQRLSLIKYLVDALKFKSFAEIQRQIVKQWKKNVIFCSINTIWSTKMQVHKFKSLQQFVQEYKKQVALIANLSYFYFKDALVLIDGKNSATFDYIHQDTSHNILNSLRDWPKLYKDTFLPLLHRRNLNHKSLMDMQFDPQSLHINAQYLDVLSGKLQLVQTIQKIRELSNQCSIHNKIQLLKKIRQTFIKQVTLNRQQIAKNNEKLRFSPLEKDDIIGCMIYCIICGQIKDIQGSIKSISQLLGPKNELLSRKGVDSYRADLESAVEYLCQQSQAKSNRKYSEQEEMMVRLQTENNCTRLQFFHLR